MRSLKTFQWEVFKSPPQILVLCVKVGSTKALNKMEPPIPDQDPMGNL